MESLDLILVQIETLSLYSPSVSLELTDLRYEVLSLQQEVDFALLLLESYSNFQMNPPFHPAFNNLQTAIDNVIHLSPKQLATFTVQGLVDSILDNTTYEHTMNSAIETLRGFRRGVAVASKQLALYLPPSIRLTSRDDYRSVDIDSSTEGLLHEFIAQPFAMSTRDETHEPHGVKLPQQGIAKGLSSGMNTLGRCWIDASVGDDPSYRNLVGTETTLIKQLWGQTTEVLQNSPLGWVDGGSITPGQFMTMRDQLEQKLRDFLYREETAHHSIVFVGAQSSGKSTLLNALIGYDILPVGGGTVTRLPCRIIHSPTTEVPELTLDVSGLNRTLERLRDIPLQERQKNEEYDALIETQKASWALFDRKSFWLPEKVSGVDQIRQMLTWINDIILYSTLFKVGYQGFLMKKWAVVRCRLPFLNDDSIRGHFELIDIPGVTGDSSEDRWQDIAYQAIREASTLVAVVAASNVYEGTWRRLPLLIAAGSDLRATIVVATQIDQVRDDQLWDSARKTIENAFWPPPSQGGIFVQCSAINGVPLQRLHEILQQAETKPSYDELLDKQLHLALAETWGRDSRNNYKEETLETARQIVADSLETTRLPKTLSDIREYLIGPSERKYYTQEASGLAIKTQSLIALLELQMSALRLVPPNLKKEEGQLHELQGKALAVISTIRSRLQLLRSNYKAVLDTAEESINSGLNANIDKLLIERRPTNAPRRAQLHFESAADAEQFVKSIQDALYEMLLSLQDRMLASILDNAATLLRADIEDDLSYLLAHGAEDSLKNLHSRRQPLPPAMRPHFEAVTAFTRSSTNEQYPRARSDEFKKRQERLLDQWSFGGKSKGTARSLDTISPFYRAILAAVAFIPFAFRIPSSQVQSPPRLEFDIEGLRKTYRSALIKAWEEQVSPDLQGAVDKTIEEAVSILDNSVSSVVMSSAENLSKLKEYPPSGLESKVIDGLVHNYCNLAAVLGAFERLIELFAYGNSTTGRGS